MTMTTEEYGFRSATEQAEHHKKHGGGFGEDMADDLHARSALALEDDDREAIAKAREDLYTTLGLLTCERPPSADLLRVSDRGELEMLVDLLNHALALRNVIRTAFVKASHGQEVIDKAREVSARERKDREEWEELLTFLYTPSDEDETKH